MVQATVIPNNLPTAAVASHAELLKAGGLYARLYRIQFRTHEGAELAG